MAEELVCADPDSPDGYWSCYQAREKLQQYELALADLDKVISLEQPQWIVYECRGNILRALGRYRKRSTISIAQKPSIRPTGMADLVISSAPIATPA